MLYVVGGYGRSGTSMMMQCLEAGGLDAVYDRADLREITKKITNFRNYDGRLIKVWRKHIGRIPADLPTQMVYMWREPSCIARSAAKFWRGTYDVDLIRREQEHWLRYAQDAQHIEVIRADYDDVCAAPFEFFTQINTRGWSIDADAAAAQVITDGLE